MANAATLEQDPGSFRDPSGRIFIQNDRVLRFITPYAAKAYRSVKDSGLLDELAAEGLLVAAKEMDATGHSNTAYILEHPRLPLISYPYEWSFALLREAALLHLNLHIRLLKRGFTLSDASAYNVQFQGASPVFIDHLSIRPWREGEIWTGHRQFCMQFLNPLILNVKLGIPHNMFFRGNLEGIEPELLAKLLPVSSRLSWTILSHVFLQASLQKKSNNASMQELGNIRNTKLSLRGFTSILEGLRDYIGALALPAQKTEWSDYATHNSYAIEETKTKEQFIAQAVSAVRPQILWDIGCNTGHFSAIALENGANHVIGWDIDHGALMQAFERSRSNHLNFLPLWLDAANPSPNHGWSQQERQGFAERASRTDMLLSLAFLHHIVIGRNIPLEWAVDWLIKLAPSGIIEFPLKHDPMVQRLLALREDIFPDYHEEAFLSHVSSRASIVRKEMLTSGTRLLIHYDRSER